MLVVISSAKSMDLVSWPLVRRQLSFYPLCNKLLLEQHYHGRNGYRHAKWTTVQKAGQPSNLCREG